MTARVQGREFVSNLTRRRTRGHRKFDADPIVSPTHRIPAETINAPGPSCSGGAHRRCLLTAEQCSCPCHHDPEFAVTAAEPARAAAAAYECPACATSYPTAAARAGHLERAHPVDLGHEWKFCPSCTAAFDVGAQLDRHVRASHPETLVSRGRPASVTPTTAGTAAVPESSPTGSAPVGDVPGAAATPVSNTS